MAEQLPVSVPLVRRHLVHFLIDVAITQETYGATRSDSSHLDAKTQRMYDADYATFMEASEQEINLCLEAVAGLPFYRPAGTILLTEWHGRMPIPPRPHLWSVHGHDSLVPIRHELLLETLSTQYLS